MMKEKLNGLALCAGVGGLELGLSIALGDAYRTVAYVEREAFAAATLVARMEEQALDKAPIWSDLTTFDGNWFRGSVDIVSGGFPCQPWSVAGKRKGTDDDRWLWPSIAKIVRQVGPRYVFLENVPGLVRGGLYHVLNDLAEMGFDAEWGCFSAAEVGASHKRERVFILAHTDNGGSQTGWSERLGPLRHRSNEDIGSAVEKSDCEVADSQDTKRRPEPKAEGRDRGGSSGEDAAMVHPHQPGLQGWVEPVEQGADQLPPWPPGPSEQRAWKEVLAINPSIEPAVRGVADGVASRVDRLRACGNGVVPLQAAYAFTILAERLKESK